MFFNMCNETKDAKGCITKDLWIPFVTAARVPSTWKKRVDFALFLSNTQVPRLISCIFCEPCLAKDTFFPWCPSRITWLHGAVSALISLAVATNIFRIGNRCFNMLHWAEWRTIPSLVSMYMIYSMIATFWSRIRAVM